ncbi:MAG: DsrE family protein [Candidatus Hydrogenedentes bacterium]|nr:DsrE family protein [Candidatus Hydrogenedentota bacterium]
MNRMFHFSVFFALCLTAALTFSMLSGGVLSGAQENKPGILVNVTSGKDSLHAVSMGLGLAKTALEKGQEVVVFLNVDAAVFATKSLGDDVQIADFAPVKKLVGDIIAAGGTVAVCEHCAHVCKVDTTDLVDGAVLSAHGSVLDMLKPGMVGFSY